MAEPGTNSARPTPARQTVRPAAGTCSETPALDLVSLVTEHHEVLYRYAFRLTGSVPDAEDLAQQTFLIAQQKLVQVREAECVRGWLFAVLRNAYLKGFRKRTPLPASSVELDVNLIVAAEAEQPLDGEQLQAALNELADEFKLVVLLFYFEQRSYREIAEILQVPLGTIMSRLSRAKAQLRQKLFAADEQPAAPPNPGGSQRSATQRTTGHGRGSAGGSRPVGARP